MIPGGFDINLNSIQHFLGGRQIARRLQDEHPICGGRHNMQFPVRADVVDTRIRARVGHENQSFVEPHCQAVSHRALQNKNINVISPVLPMVYVGRQLCIGWPRPGPESPQVAGIAPRFDF
jgi:hypothetical protein